MHRHTPYYSFSIQKCLSFEAHLARVADKGSWTWTRVKRIQPSFQGYGLIQDFTRVPLKTFQVCPASSAVDSCLGFLPYHLLCVVSELPWLFLSLSFEKALYFMRTVVSNGPSDCTRLWTKHSQGHVVYLLKQQMLLLHYCWDLCGTPFSHNFHLNPNYGLAIKARWAKVNCYQAWQSKFKLQNPHMGGGNQLLPNYAYHHTHAMMHVQTCSHACIHAHTQK